MCQRPPETAVRSGAGPRAVCVGRLGGGSIVRWLPHLSGVVVECLVCEVGDLPVPSDVAHDDDAS